MVQRPKTLSRSEIVDFTQHTFITGAALLSLNNFQIKKVSDLAGKKIAVVKDTTTLASLAKMLASAGSDAKIIQVKSAEEAMNALVKGEVHAFAGDQIVLIGLIVTNPDPKQFSLSEDVFSFEPFALAVRQNDSEFRLIAGSCAGKAVSKQRHFTPVRKMVRQVPEKDALTARSHVPGEFNA